MSRHGRDSRQREEHEEHPSEARGEQVLWGDHKSKFLKIGT